MSNTEELKSYLINDDDGFLLNPDNNGKTIMLSGAWGAGKTHFWQEEIAREQSKILIDGNEKIKYEDKQYKEGLSYLLKDKKKACVYVSLYGKDSLDDIKQEIFLKASTENDYLSEDIEAFGYRALSSISDTNGIIGTLFKTGIDLNEYRKHGKGENKLKQGGLICFDDFERKSKEIDLNDLFGFISQLAIVLKCKVVIILNSDVFEGEEANVFKNVKEKTVNKYFHFDPTSKELFDSVAKDKKYDQLNEYKVEILKAIEETEELNARIYIQVLDNCLEWMKKIDDNSVFRVLVLSTVCFIKNHFLLSYPNIRMHRNSNYYDFYYKEIQDYVYPIKSAFPTFYDANPNDMELSEFKNNTELEILKNIKNNIGVKNNDKQNVYSDPQQSEYLKWVSENNNLIKEINKYGYKLYVSMGIEENVYEEIVFFVKTGILPKNPKEVESSLPPESIAKIKA